VSNLHLKSSGRLPMSVIATPQETCYVKLSKSSQRDKEMATMYITRRGMYCASSCIVFSLKVMQLLQMRWVQLSPNLDKIWKQAVVALLIYHHAICPERQGKATITFIFWGFRRVVTVDAVVLGCEATLCFEEVQHLHHQESNSVLPRISDHWRWSKYVPSRRRDPITPWRMVLSQKKKPHANSIITGVPANMRNPRKKDRSITAWPNLADKFRYQS